MTPEHHDLTFFDSFLRTAAKQYGCALSDCFDDEYPWHDCILREMSKELNLVSRHILEGLNLLAGLDLQDSVHHNEWEPLFQETLYFLKIHGHV